jgi:hypothetical protein
MGRKEGEEEYMVRVYTRRLPESFKGPVILKKLFSALSESPNAEIGNNWRGMPLDKAQEIANEETHGSYVDGNGHLRSSKGVVVRVR